MGSEYNDGSDGCVMSKYNDACMGLVSLLATVSLSLPLSTMMGKYNDG
jgi:hypothetical protein